MKSSLLALIGPTASGKSDAALGVAQPLGGEILSVDSMQVYCGMDLGTAKPTVAERWATPHYLIDVVEPTETFTVAKFVELADSVIRDAAARGVPLIATGGTPLYYKALFEGLFDGPSADDAVRGKLRLWENAELHRRLTEVDPPAAARIHLQDTRRLIRALEVYELTGRPISSFQTEWQERVVRHPAVWVGLSWEKDAINRRINARVKAMLAAGWIEETQALIERHGSLSGTAAEATGYFELSEYLAGRLNLADAVERIKIATRQLARRQMKWFRRFPNVTWISGDRPREEIARDISEIWERGASPA